MAYNFLECTIGDNLVADVDDADEVVGGDYSDSEDDNISCQSYVSEIESEADEIVKLEHNLRGKNGFKWSPSAPDKHPDQQIGTPPVNIPGPRNAAAEKKSIEEFWDLLFSDSIIKIIVHHTNNKIEDVCSRMMAKDQEMQSYHHLTDDIEIRGFIGVLYYSGMWRASNLDYHYLWSHENGINIYRCAMPRCRFVFLALCIRFDDKAKRNPNDKLSPIREIWDIFIANCIEMYEPHPLCTVDEQLLSFRGRCPFKVCVKSQPDKCGLKIISLNDAHTAYMINAIPYTGKVTLNKGDSHPEYFFRTVTQPIHGQNRSVTCNNKFTTIPLLENMLKAPYSMTITGTVKKNKAEIPIEMTRASTVVPGLKLCYNKNIKLLSYTPRKNKIKLVASTYIHDNSTTGDEPDLIKHYNKTKIGTDQFHQLCQSYTVARRTLRWPMRIFYSMLDQAAVNARILYTTKKHQHGPHPKLSAFKSLNKIFSHLLTPLLQQRYAVATLSKTLRAGIATFLNIDLVRHESEKKDLKIRLETYKRCALCPSRADRKTKSGCCSCERPMCDKHQAGLCTDCAGYDP